MPTPDRAVGITPGRPGPQSTTPGRSSRFLPGSRGRCSAGYVTAALAVVLLFMFAAPLLYLRSRAPASEQLPARLKDQLPSVRAQRQARMIEEQETKVRSMGPSRWLAILYTVASSRSQRLMVVFSFGLFRRVDKLPLCAQLPIARLDVGSTEPIGTVAACCAPYCSMWRLACGKQHTHRRGLVWWLVPPQEEESLDHIPIVVLSSGQGRWNTGVWTGFGEKQPTLNWAAAGVVVVRSGSWGVVVVGGACGLRTS
jgi:sarcosine oxidase gamma subunit